VTRAPDISRRGGELLLRALEQHELVIAAAATDDLPSDLLSSLLNSGALERHTASRAALVADDDGARERWRWLGHQYLKIGGRVVYRLADIEAYEATQVHASTSHPLRAG
jgi:hypothetical protein